MPGNCLLMHCGDAAPAGSAGECGEHAVEVQYGHTFGAGVRRCVGAGFALTEMDIVVRTVLRHYRIQTDTVPGEKSHFRGVAHTPKCGGRIVVSRRSRPA